MENGVVAESGTHCDRGIVHRLVSTERPDHRINRLPSQTATEKDTR